MKSVIEVCNISVCYDVMQTVWNREIQDHDRVHASCTTVAFLDIAGSHTLYCLADSESCFTVRTPPRAKARSDTADR